MKKRALILGAKSAIARAIALRLVTDGYDLALAARQVEALSPFAADIQLRHQSQVDLIEFDGLDFGALEHLPQRVERIAGPFELSVLVFGYLGRQRETERSTGEMLNVLNANFTGAAVALGLSLIHI